MARIIIKQTSIQTFRTTNDYRVHLNKITNDASANGDDGDIILNTATKKLVKCTNEGSNEYPLEQNVVYLVPEQVGNETINKLYVWNGATIEQIGTSSMTTDYWSAGTYIITTDINQDIVLSGPSTLIFEGGSFLAGLTGNKTAIQAPPVRIFGDNISLQGTFVNKSAYPEWWGAVPSPINIHIQSPSAQPGTSADNKLYIQRAFDSCFGEIEFCCGNYYVGSTLILTKMKTIKMQGLGLRKNTTQNNDFTTVIWTNQNIDVLKIDIPQEQTSNGRLLIEGGEINVSECSGDTPVNNNEPPCYTKSAILFNPTGEWGGRISVSIIGPILHAGRTNGQINWTNMKCHCPSDEELRNNYKGSGIRFNNSTVVDEHSAYVFTLDCYIFGFGRGIAVDYTPSLANMTSLHVYGVINQCFIYLHAPSRAFNGGVFEPTIQCCAINAPDGYDKPIIQGNYINAYLNPYIWDLHQDVDFFDFNESTKNVCFGPRIIGLMNSSARRRGMSTEDLAAIVSNNQSNLLGSMGNFDTQQLSAINTVTQSENYTHFIDNDLLGIDKIFNKPCKVLDEGFVGTVSWSNSPFERGGMTINFTDSVDNDNAKLTIVCDLSSSVTGYSANSTRVQLLAIHLKDTTYNYFENLEVKVDNETFFNGSYADIPLVKGYNDIIIPLMRCGRENPTAVDTFNLGIITLKFEKLRIRSNVWGTERFKVAIEGRLNRHYKNNVWSAAGGDLGNHIMLKGKPYIVGTGDYTSLNSLPSNASIGAIAVVNDMYPVIKTQQGWMIQNLCGTSSSLNALGLNMGLTTGQMAVATDLNKVVWWNVNHWYDAMGNLI